MPVPVFLQLPGRTVQKVPKQDGPVFYLYNHTTDLDFLMLVAAAEDPAYFVVTDSFVRGGKLAERLSERYSFILHDKGGSGITTAREILERIRDGYSVAMAPEGNRSFDGVTCPIPDSVAKLVRKSGATLVTFRFTGGYFTSPRWSRGFRRGRIMGKPMGIYTPEGLKEMKPKELADRIREDLWVDAMTDEKKRPIPYQSRHRAEYLESLLYLCPKCRTFDSLYADIPWNTRNMDILRMSVEEDAASLYWLRGRSGNWEGSFAQRRRVQIRLFF